MKTNKEKFKFIEPFLASEGISGFERKIAKLYIDAAKSYNCKIERDGFGSVIAMRGNSGPKIMLATHMDEVGFLVTKIEKEGFLRVSQLGRSWSHTLPSMRVKVRTRQGQYHYGLMGAKTIHTLNPEQRSKMMQDKEHFVDLGFTSEKTARDHGIQVGDEVIRIAKPFLMSNTDRFCARAIDNRISVAIMTNILKNLQDSKLKCQLYAVATTQEEVGSRGAKVSAQQIAPDVAITLDTCTSNDTPGVESSVNVLGAGAAITIADAYYIANPVLCDQLIEIAQKNNIKAYRYVSTAGGNDSEMTQWAKGGIPVVTIAPPTRYMHTDSEVADLNDFQAIVDLVTAFIKSFDQQALAKMQYQ